MRLTFAAPAARKTATFAALALSLFYSGPALAQGRGAIRKLDQELTARNAIHATWRQTRLIVRLNGKPLPPELQLYRRAHLDLIDAWILELPDTAINVVAQHPDVADAHFDREIWA